MLKASFNVDSCTPSYAREMEHVKMPSNCMTYLPMRHHMQPTISTSPSRGSFSASWTFLSYEPRVPQPTARVTRQTPFLTKSHFHKNNTNSNSLIVAISTLSPPHQSPHPFLHTHPPWPHKQLARMSTLLAASNKYPTTCPALVAQV